MNIEKMIEQLNRYFEGETLPRGTALDAATALSTLKEENEKLRAELEHVKEERNAAVKQLHGLCSACKNYSPYHNKGKCRYCLYESARNKDAEANDNWEWRDQEEEN